MSNSKIIIACTIGAILVMLSSCGGSGEYKITPVSGYKYKIYTSNNGAKPQPGEQVFFQMDILDDQDSVLQSYRDQKVLPSIKMVELADPMRKKNAIVDVLGAMAVGDSVDLLIPTDSIPNMPPGLDDLEHLTYRVVTKEILSEAAFQQRMQEDQAKAMQAMEEMKGRRVEVEAMTSQVLKDYKAGKLELKESSLGVKYIIHTAGEGDKGSNDRMVSMHYFGRTVSTGVNFDDSFKKGQPYSFRLGRGSVIKGWDDVILNLSVGSTASVFIPSELGYGTRGSGPSIPPGSELYFYMEFVEQLY